MELDLRSLKTTMGIETLHGQTPQMNEKKFWEHPLVYNLIRLRWPRSPAWPVSIHAYKHTCQLWNNWLFAWAAGPRISANGVKVPTYLYKLVYDATTQRAWAHWQQNREGETVGRPISYQELVNRTGMEFLPRNAFQN